MARLLAAAVGIALAILAGTAEARPQHKKHLQHVTAHVVAMDPAIVDHRFDFLGGVRSAAPGGGAGTVFGAFGPSYLSRALADVGANARQLGVQRTLWCAEWLNKKLEQSGIKGTGSRMAKSFAKWGRPAGPQAGAIAVMSRNGGGHVGIVLADNGSTVTIVSGNHNQRVEVADYPKRRIYAYRLP